METDEAEVVREIELDIDADVVWELVADPDELAGWVGDEVRTARFDTPRPDARGDGGSGDGASRRLGWTWAPDGVESIVELTVHELITPGAGARTVVRVVERVTEPVGASGATGGDRWEARLFHLDLLCALAASLVPARR